ncbi:hypothetical protein COOONC_27654 [Cooperia oncophora]
MIYPHCTFVTFIRDARMSIPDDVSRSEAETESPLSHEALIASSLGWSVETEKLAGKEHFVAVCDYCARDFVLGDIVFDPVKRHQRWCPVLDVNEDDGVPLWRLIYSRLAPVRQQVRTKKVKTLFLRSAYHSRICNSEGRI